MLHTTEVIAIVEIFVYFGQHLVAMTTSIRPLQSEIYFLDG